MIEDDGPVIWEADGGGSGTTTVMLDTEESYTITVTAGTGTGATSAGVVLAAGPWIPIADGPNGVVCQAMVSATNGNSKSLWLKNIKIKEVSFSGTKYYELKSDDVSVTYSAPHWLDNNGDGDTVDMDEHDYSVAYTRNTKPKIAALFTASNLPAGMTTLTMRVVGNNGIQNGDIETPEVTAQISGADVTFPVTESSNAWPNTVKFYDRSDDPIKAFKLDWEIKVDGAWSKVGDTKHQVYLTLADPVTTALRHETLFYLSAKNADGKTTEGDVHDAVWSDFTDREVKSVDGTQLTYYESWKIPDNITTPKLLKHRDGECTAWAKFFIDLRKVHGIDVANELIQFRIVDFEADSAFLVEDWHFNEAGTKTGILTHPYLNIPQDPFPGLNSFAWKYTEITDSAGIEGQGTDNPLSMFRFHYVVLYGGKYYDPSYGTTHTSLTDFEKNAIAGYCLVINATVDEAAYSLDLNGDGDEVDDVIHKVLLVRKNPAGLDANITQAITNY